MRYRGLIPALLFLSSLEAAGQNNGFVTTAQKEEFVDSAVHFAKQNGEYFTSAVNDIYSGTQKKQLVLGYSKNNLPVVAYFFPGTSDKRAVVIGGVHGSELASVDVAEMLIAQLEANEKPYYNVIIIPSLFPANAEKAFLLNESKTNFGRYTSDQHADPNRQMPLLGKAFDEANPFDSYGRTIENENIYLLRLIQQFKPSRMINLHAIRDTSRAGIYADPRTDCRGAALGFESDNELALTMARFIQDHGGTVPGNQLTNAPTALYYKDPPVASTGSFQKRNLLGSKLPGNRGAGVSLGSWATTAVCDEIFFRDAIRLLTVEFPGYQSYTQPGSEIEKRDRFRNVYLFATSIKRIFLESIVAD